MTIEKNQIPCRLLLTVAPLFLLAGCIVAPRFEVTEQINFNYQQFGQPVIDESDALCEA